MSIILREFLRDFQKNCLLNGIERVTLLQKVVAGGAAYAAPCYLGSVGESGMYYRNGVLTPAVKYLTEINEMFIINTDAVMADTKLLWEGRYLCLNSPVVNKNLEHFHRSLMNGDIDLTDKYNYWVAKLVPIAEAYFAEITCEGAV